MIVEKPNVFLDLRKKMLLNLVAKTKFYTIIYHYMTSYGYIIMIRIYSGII